MRRVLTILAAIAVVVGAVVGFLTFSGRMTLPFSSKEAESAGAEESGEGGKSEDEEEGGSFLKNLLSGKKSEGSDGEEPKGGFDDSRLEIPWGATGFRGMDARLLVSAPWKEQRFDALNYYIWDGRLLTDDFHGVENPDGGSVFRAWELTSRDLETGEEIFSMPIDVGELPSNHYGDVPYTLRQVYETPGHFCIVTPREYREYTLDGELTAVYPIPDAARYWDGEPSEDPYPSIYGPNWDLRPELDLLVWADPDGVWAAEASGENPRLVVETSELSELFFDNDLDPWDNVIFRTPRIKNGGKTLSLDFGVPSPPWQHSGHMVVSLEEGWTKRYTIEPSGIYYYLDHPDDTNILLGPLHIDAVTGEEIRGAGQENGSGLSAVTGDFSRYFGARRLDEQYHLVTYKNDDRDNGEHILILPSIGWEDPDGEEPYNVITAVAATANQAIYHYQRGDENGLLLVTVPED